MPMSMSNLQERRFFDALFGGAPTLVVPATMYFALFVTLPDENGANGLEVSGNGYARVPIANVTTSFAPATTSAGMVTSKWNSVSITFPADVTADWGQVIGLGTFDALSSGNLLWMADITPFRQIQVGDTAQVPAISLTMTLD